jgi:hypothetical protein
MNPAKQTLRNKISLNIPDNHARAVTPALLRDVLENMLDFSEDAATGGIQDLTTTEDSAEWDVELGNKAMITLSGDVALSLTNATPGGMYWLAVKQDVTGGHTLTLPPDSIFENGQEPGVSDEPGAITVLPVLFDGTNYLWLGKNGNDTAAVLWQRMDW